MLDAIKTFYGLKQNRTAQQSTDGHFAWNSAVYLFSNENLNGYIAHNPDICGGRVLSVCASGDHAFESLLAGASSVDTFDVNYMQKHVMELKTKMIQHLSYEQFMDFFFSSYNRYDRRIIKPIWSKLSLGARLFWHTVFKNWHLCRGGNRTGFDTARCLSYVGDPLAYDRLKRLIPDHKINFIESDVLNIMGRITQKYDAVLLSNIMTYVLPGAAYVPQMMDFYERVLTPLAQQHLNNGAVVYFNYIWGSDTNIRWREQFRDLMVHRDMIDSYNLEPYHEFSSQEFQSGFKNDRNVKRDCVAMMRHRTR